MDYVAFQRPPATGKLLANFLGWHIVRLETSDSLEFLVARGRKAKNTGDLGRRAGKLLANFWAGKLFAWNSRFIGFSSRSGADGQGCKSRPRIDTKSKMLSIVCPQLLE